MAAGVKAPKDKGKAKAEPPQHMAAGVKARKAKGAKVTLEKGKAKAKAEGMPKAAEGMAPALNRLSKGIFSLYKPLKESADERLTRTRDYFSENTGTSFEAH